MPHKRCPIRDAAAKRPAAKRPRRLVIYISERYTVMYRIGRSLIKIIRPMILELLSCCRDDALLKNIDERRVIKCHKYQLLIIISNNLCINQCIIKSFMHCYMHYNLEFQVILSGDYCIPDFGVDNQELV